MLLNDDSRHVRGGDLAALLGAISDVDSVLLSPHTHEIRGYNRLATLSAGDYIVFVQDDTLPPLPTADISWLAHSASLFLRWPQESAPPMGPEAGGEWCDANGPWRAVSAARDE